MIVDKMLVEPIGLPFPHDWIPPLKSNRHRVSAGAQDTEPVSLVGYNALIVRLNLGLGSAVSILIFLGVLIIAAVYLKGLGPALTRSLGER